MPNPSEDAVREQVRTGYSEIAKRGQWSGVRPASAGLAVVPSESSGGGGCCGPTTLNADQVAAAVGYAQTDLQSLPDGANLGLSCGNPTALASLREGEVVLDLGCGGGFDCFIAGPKVGASGRVIGVDMTPEMLSRARGNIAAYTERSGLSNVEFRLGEIEHLPVADASVDVVISNCVINLSPNKQQVWSEMARVLKPGGRLAVSDLALIQPLPDAVRADVEALVGCVAGAELVSRTEELIAEAGLVDLELRSKPEYIATMTQWQDPLYQKIAAGLPESASIDQYVTSLDISARKA
jgi:arsenite methyltransferase